MNCLHIRVEGKTWHRRREECETKHGIEEGEGGCQIATIWPRPILLLSCKPSSLSPTSNVSRPSIKIGSSQKIKKFHMLVSLFRSEQPNRSLTILLRCASISCFQVVSEYVILFQIFSLYSCTVSRVSTISTVSTVSIVSTVSTLYILHSLHSLHSLYSLFSLHSLYSLYRLHRLHSLHSFHSLYSLQSLNSFQVLQVLLAHVRVDF